MISPFLSAVEDFLFTRTCALCERPLVRGQFASPAGWRAACCETCAQELDAPPRPACRRCGADVGPHLDRLSDCGFCRGERYRFTRTWRIGVYDGVLRQAILRAKTGRQRALTKSLVGLLWERQGDAIREEDPAVVTAVPHLWWQAPWSLDRPADVLAEELSRRLGIPHDAGLVRKVRWIRRQASLTPSGRRTNVRGAFIGDRRADLNGATVLLVDDVMTTGSTANACARSLERIGAGKVVVAVFARGLGRRGLSGP
jgi:predicted amidophosphoribosyltransferase